MKINDLTLGELKEAHKELNELFCNKKDNAEISKERAVVVFANNAIIFGYTSATKLGQVTINKARYAHYYAKCKLGENNGFMALAKYGPQTGSKVASPVDNVTVDACCIIDATNEAIVTWENSEWK